MEAADTPADGRGGLVFVGASTAMMSVFHSRSHEPVEYSAVAIVRLGTAIRMGL